MDLKKYLEAQSIRQEDFARRVKTSQPVISKLTRGRMNPGPALASRIHNETEGQVPYWSWAPYASFAPDAKGAG